MKVLKCTAMRSKPNLPNYIKNSYKIVKERESNSKELKDFDEYFRRVLNGNKHPKRLSISLIIKETQIKTTLKTKITDNTSVGTDVE